MVIGDYPIYKSNSGVCLYVSGDKQGGKGRHQPTGPVGGPQQPYGWCLCGQCLEDSSSHCPFPMELVTNRAGQGGQGSYSEGPREVPFLLKKSLGKTGGPSSNQT